MTDASRASHAARTGFPANLAARSGFAAFAISAVFLAVIALFWNGVGPADAENYIAAALDWKESGPFLGDSHWALRHLFVLPMAGVFVLFGPGEFAVTVPNILYAAGLVAVTFVFARRFLGAETGLIAALFVALSSFLVEMQFEVRIDGVQLFFSALAAWLFIAGLQGEGGAARRLFFLAGLCAGGAWLCREAALYLPIGFGLVAMWRLKQPLGALALIGAGFGAVIAGELLLYAIVAGDAFYRYAVDFGHNGAKTVADLVAPEREGLFELLATPFVNLVTYPVATPFVLLGALVWLAPGLRASFAAGERRDIAAVFGVTSAVAFVMSSYALHLNQLHYFPIFVYAAVLSLAAFTAHLFQSGRRWLGAAFFLGIVFLNAASADFRSYDEYAEARYLAALVQRSDETIGADVITAARATSYLRLAGATKSEAEQRLRVIRNGQSGCGLVYVATPRGAKPAVEPPPAWRLEERRKVRKERWTHGLLRYLGAAHWPSSRLQEIVAGAAPVALYRGPACDDGQ